MIDQMLQGLGPAGTQILRCEPGVPGLILENRSKTDRRRLLSSPILKNRCPDRFSRKNDRRDWFQPIADALGLWAQPPSLVLRRSSLKIHQRGVQWKQGLVVYIIE